MTKQELPAEILSPPPDERVALPGEAWDSMAATPEDVPIPEWHVQEHRLAAPDPEFVSWETVRRRLQAAG